MWRLWITLGFMLTALTARAQDTQSFVQTHLDALFWIDADAQMTTAAYGIGFMSDDLTPREWVFALPPAAEVVGLAPGTLPDLISAYSYMDFFPPDYYPYCNLSPTWTGFSGYGWYTLDVREIPSAAGPTALSETAAAAIFPAQRDRIAAYAQAGWSFVALTLQPQPAPEGSDLISSYVQRSPLIIVRYPGTTALLPLALHAENLRALDDEFISVAGSLRSRVAIFAEGQYGSANLTSLDFTDARSSVHMLRDAMRLTSSPVEVPSAGLNLLINALHHANGFVRTWVSAAPVIERDDYAATLFPAAAAYYDTPTAPTLTRFDAVLTPPIADISFTPDGPAPASRFIYPTPREINPLTYWGCTTRTLHDPELEARLPAARTRIDELGITLAHPAEWQVSTVADSTVIAPQTVGMAELRAIESGSLAFPALVISPQMRAYSRSEYGISDLRDDLWIGITTDQHDAPSFIDWRFFPERIPLAALNAYNGDPTQPFEGVQIGLFVPAAASESDLALYRDMIDYAQRMQFITADDLRHTLYLGRDGHTAAVGYPDGWVERIDEEAVLLLPEGAAPENAPTIRIISGVEVSADVAGGTLINYEVEGRRGFRVATGAGDWTIAEFTAPTALYDQYADLLLHLARNLRPYSAGSPPG